MQIGVVGKTNTGKSTFFSAATLVDVEISNRPFVTIKPNQGTSFVTARCVHSEIGKQCNPQNSKCANGVRMIPITLLDVAGLVPNAHEGKGLGNQFLNDLMQAQALVHVLDASGRTDFEGNPCTDHDVCGDVRFLEREIAYWIKGILSKNWHAIAKKAIVEKKSIPALASQLTGLGISENDVKEVVKKQDFSENIEAWSEGEMLRFSQEIQKESKPILIAANKVDLPESKENIEKLRKEFPEKKIIPVCAEAELALRKAERQGLIDYIPGNKEFKVLKELSEKQKKALEFIQEKVLNVWGSTGVQQAINATAFELLDLIVAYPVEDAHKWVDSKGNVLPSAFLLKKGSNALDLALKVHSSFGERFIAAIDCKTSQKIGKEHELKNNDVVKIQLSH